MSKKWISLLSLAAVTPLVFVACSGGSYSRVDSGGVVQCAPADSYNPLPKDLPTDGNRSKASWGDGASDALEAGQYEYIGMDLYFEDTSTGFQFHTSEVKLDAPKGEEDDQKYEIRRICARNATNIGNLNVSLAFPADISIAEGGKTTSTTRTMTVSFSDRLDVKGEPGETLEVPPSKVTGDQNYVSQLYRTKTRDGAIVFEDRMEDLSGPVKKWVLVRYKKIP